MGLAALTTLDDMATSEFDECIVSISENRSRLFSFLLVLVFMWISLVCSSDKVKPTAFCFKLTVKSTTTH